MLLGILILITWCEIMDAVYLYDDEDSTRHTFNATEEMEFEPVTLRSDHRIPIGKNINCEDFSRYALNCTMEAALMYNSSRKAPPLPYKIGDWCRAIRHLTNCAIDWNSDCREVTESHFNEESIKGHMHVVENVCEDDWFITRTDFSKDLGSVPGSSKIGRIFDTIRVKYHKSAFEYDDLSICIETVSDIWEACYTTFKAEVDEQKNKTLEWTHYDTHFYLCCARAEFRRCSLDALFATPKCTQTQAVALQKFSIVVSEGDVFQDCDSKMVYSSCPGGDPRPSSKHLNSLMNLNSRSSSRRMSVCNALLVLVLCCWLFWS